MRRRLVLSGLAGALLPARPAAACALREQGRVPVEIVGGSLCVEVKINGHPARMILDTGAQRTLIQTAALQRLELEQDSSAAASCSIRVRAILPSELRPLSTSSRCRSSALNSVCSSV